MRIRTNRNAPRHRRNRHHGGALISWCRRQFALYGSRHAAVVATHRYKIWKFVWATAVLICNGIRCVLGIREQLVRIFRYSFAINVFYFRFFLFCDLLATDEGTTKTFTCARPLVGQYVAIQMVGVESSLSLCEVEVFSNDGMCAQFAFFPRINKNLNYFHFRTEFSPDRCAAPNLNAEIILSTFSRTCYEFHVTRGESYDKAQQTCKSHGETDDTLTTNFCQINAIAIAFTTCLCSMTCDNIVETVSIWNVFVSFLCRRRFDSQFQWSDERLHSVRVGASKGGIAYETCVDRCSEGTWIHVAHMEMG